MWLQCSLASWEQSTTAWTEAVDCGAVNEMTALFYTAERYLPVSACITELHGGVRQARHSLPLSGLSQQQQQDMRGSAQNAKPAVKTSLGPEAGMRL